jgi:hypothetical protein
MPRSRTIPAEIRKRAAKAVEQFNQEHLSDEVRYVPRFQGRYLYLDREDYGDRGPICRLEFTGEFDAWEFAIYRFSSETYDPEECFFPGNEHLDGSLEGAMFAGLEAYAP